MILKEAVHQNCSKCGRLEKEINPEQLGCDFCTTPIVPYGNDERLDVTVFHEEGKEPQYFYFCSWHCVFRFTKTIKTTYFFTLPYVSMGNKIVGRRGKDYFKEISKIGKA